MDYKVEYTDTAITNLKEIVEILCIWHGSRNNPGF